MSEWDAIAGEWDDVPAVRAYADAAFASLTSLAAESGIELVGLAVLDFGCGTGLLTERLVPHSDRLDAVDSSSAMLDVLRAKVTRDGWTNVRVLGDLPAESQGYALIVCSSVLGFVDDYSATVLALASHLMPGGLFVQWDWEREAGDDASGLAIAEIDAALRAAGLDEVRVGTGFEVEVDGDTMRPLMGSGRRPG